MKYVAITGCAGFIGRVLTRQLLKEGRYVFGIDALTYAADPECIREFQTYPNFCFVNRDIRDPELSYLPDVDAILHLAAETHVDRSIDGPSRFTSVNVVGTHHLLELARKVTTLKRFVYVSTDEVYGPVEAPWKATHEWAMKPSSPYAATKAAADLMVQAYGTTFGLPYTILRPTNCFGPLQYPEKLVPKTVRSLMLGRPMTIHGDGSQVRQWLSVWDAAEAITFALDNATRLPPIVNVGGDCEASVNSVVAAIGRAYIEQPSDPDIKVGVGVEYGHVRPGCDQRYAVCDQPIRGAGWRPRRFLFDELPSIVSAERRNFRF